MKFYLAFTLLLISLAACNENHPYPLAGLRVGDSIEIDGNRAVFHSIEVDYRRLSTDPRLLGYGIAVARIEMDNGDVLRVSTATRSDIPSIPREIEYQGRTIRLERLDPQPLDYEPIPQRDYRLFLVVE